MASFQAPIFNSKKFFVPSVSDKVDLAEKKINQAESSVKKAASAAPTGVDLYAVGSCRDIRDCLEAEALPHFLS